MDSHRTSASHMADDKASEKLDHESPRTPTSHDGLPQSRLSSDQGRDLEKNQLPGQSSQQARGGATGEKDPAFKVDFDENDPTNPRLFSSTKKALVTLLLGFMALTGSLGSSIISPAAPQLSQYLGVSSEVTVFTVSLFILGFAFGPQMWAPISEVYGRKWSMLPAMFCLGAWSIGTAVSKNAASVFITRFFGGVFGAASVSNVSAALGDMYEPKARGIAVTFYAVMVVGGPTLGPVIGSSLTVTLGWRWTEYIEAIFTFFMVRFQNHNAWDIANLDSSSF